MNAKNTIQKFLIALVWIASSSSLLVLLVAAVGKQNNQTCQGYAILLKGEENQLFINEKEVLKLVETAANGDIKGKLISRLNIKKMESLLEANKWILDAELYFDNLNILQIAVSERSPIARVFTKSGHSFYLDNTGTRIPLSAHYTARVPVFTGFPEFKKARADSVLISQIKDAAVFIDNHPFWKVQVSEIHITTEKFFEMIPVIGNHVVLLGEGVDLENKFHRLFVYYKQVAAKRGFDSYETLNVQFDGQVIGTRKNGGLPVKVLDQQRKKAVQTMQASYNDNPVIRETIKPVKEQKSNNPSPKINTQKKTVNKKEAKAVMKKRVD